MQLTVWSGCSVSPLSFDFPQCSPWSPLKLLSPRCALTSFISSTQLAKLRKILFPLYERPLGLPRPPAHCVQRCLFLGQERLFVSGGSVARGLFLSVTPIKVLFCTSSQKRGGANIKAGSLWVSTAVRHRDLVDLMGASCLSKRRAGAAEGVCRGLSTGAIKLEVR